MYYDIFVSWLNAICMYVDVKVSMYFIINLTFGCQRDILKNKNKTKTKLATKFFV